MHTPTRLAASLLISGILLGQAGTSFAASTPNGKARFTYAAGQVSNLSPTGFTLTGATRLPAVGSTSPVQAPKTAQITIDAKTREVARKGTTGSLADGEYALVLGVKSGSGFVARRVLFSATNFNAGRIGKRLVAQHVVKTLLHRKHRRTGTLDSVTAAGITIHLASGKHLTFGITPTTTYHLNGQLLQTPPVLSMGQKIVVRYTRDKVTKVLIALDVAVPAGTAPPAQP